jgi:hypothetical protein
MNWKEFIRETYTKLRADSEGFSEMGSTSVVLEYDRETGAILPAVFAEGKGR